MLSLYYISYYIIVYYIILCYIISYYIILYLCIIYYILYIMCLLFLYVHLLATGPCSKVSGHPWLRRLRAPATGPDGRRCGAGHAAPGAGRVQGEFGPETPVSIGWSGPRSLSASHQGSIWEYQHRAVGTAVLHPGDRWHAVQRLKAGSRWNLIVMAMRNDKEWKRSFYEETRLQLQEKARLAENAARGSF